LGAGYSTSEQLLANFSVGEKNLLGEGKDLRLATQLSTKRQEYNLSYTEPYFLDRNMTGGFDLFRTTSDYRQESSYKETQTGLGLRTSYEIDERWSQQLRYRVSQSEVRDVTDTASLYIQDLKGTYITSEVGQSLLYDRRDNRIQPTSGYFAKLSNDLAGVGGNVNYLRNKLEATDYQQITDGVVLAIGAEGGAIFGLDGDVRIPDRFFLGGQSFPGFRSAGLGPRDTGSDNGLNEALGGNYYYLGRSDLGFPLGLPSDFDLRGHLFGVAGTLTSVDEKSATIRDDGSLRASVGIGIAWESPFGPIRVDYAKALVKENFDRTENFLFNFGTQF
jgi:outer membrane protein insertion porin family